LLLSQVSDYGELEHLALVCFDHEDDPDDKAAEADEGPHQQREKSQERNVRDANGSGLWRL
jgi:hypothetical protein